MAPLGKEWGRSIEELLHEPLARPVLLAGAVCMACLLFLVYCVSASGSLVLMGCAWLTVFSLFSLLSALLSLGARRRPPSLQYTFGLARAPVLAVFASTVLAQLAALFLAKESVERLLEPHEPHANRLFVPGMLAATLAQTLVVYGVHNEPLHHVLTAAASSWLQEHTADLAHALCRVVPGLGQLLLPRLNALGLLASCAVVCSLLAQLLLVQRAIWWADAVAALCLSGAIVGTMWNLSAYTGRVLLQTSPPHILSQLDRCVREASTLDGVLELTGAHFWQLDFEKIAGTVVVRVRRDADEQVVLAHVTDKLGAVVGNLTVQVVKDADWNSIAHHQH